MSVCECVCVCARVRVRVCVCVMPSDFVESQLAVLDICLMGD